MELKKFSLFIQLIFVAGFFGASLHAQTIKYTYDTSGNRLSREKVINMSRLKSYSGVSGTSEVATAELPKFQDELSDMKITIYPNPTNGLLKVDITGGNIPSNAKIYLYNALGALVCQLVGIAGSNTVDISAHPAGAYVMRIVLGNNNISTWKIIKE